MDSQPQADLIRTVGLTSYEMSTMVNMAQRAFGELLKTCLSHHNLTISQWALLGLLYSSSPVRPHAAAKSLGLKPPYIARLLHELDARGVISSLVFEDDERGKEVSLNPAGRELVEYVEAKLTVCLNEQFHGLAPDDMKTYFAMTGFIARQVGHHAKGDT